jgi:hypothetical protein
VGLAKARTGQWEGLNWERIIAAITPAKINGPTRFASAARSQLWFEWRRSGRPLCIIAGVGSIGSVIIYQALRFSLGWGPLTKDSASPFTIILLGIPVFLQFASGMSPRQNDMSFILNRPAVTGQFVMAKLKADAISTLVMWGFTLVALGGLFLVGNMSQIPKDSHVPMIGWPFLILAALVITWRAGVASLCFTWTGHPRLIKVPVLMFFAAYASVILLFILKNYPNHWNTFCQFLPAMLAVLVVVKFLLAFLAFRLSLKRGLLTPSTVTGYLAVWIALATALLIPAWLVSHDTPLCLGIILLIPLARIGFCPISLSWNRHA